MDMSVLTQPNEVTSKYSGRIFYNTRFVIVQIYQIFKTDPKISLVDRLTNKTLKDVPFYKLTDIVNNTINFYNSLFTHYKEHYGLDRRCIVYDITNFYSLKTLEVHVDEFKTFTVSIRALLTDDDFLFPTLFQINKTNLSNILFLGGCSINNFIRLHKEQNNYNWQTGSIKGDKKMVRLKNRKKNNFKFQTDALTSTPSVDTLGSFNCYVLHHPLSYFFKRNKNKINENTYEDILNTAKSKFRGLVNLAVVNFTDVSPKPFFITNYILPYLTTDRSLRELYSTKRLLKEFNLYIEEYIKEINHPLIHLLDICSLTYIYNTKTLLDDTYNDHFHNMLWDSDISTSHIEENIHTTGMYNKNLNSYQYHTPLYEYYGPSQINCFHKTFIKFIDYNLRIINQTDIVKLIIFDLDNTLIRGSIAEDYMNSNYIPTPHHFGNGIKQALEILKNRGVLLALCTKNEDKNVREFLREEYTTIHYDMFDIVRANFNLKSENIKDILNVLSLTPESAVFIDDNIREQHEVKTAIPNLRVVPFNRNTLKRDLLWAAETQRLNTQNNVSHTYSKLIERKNIQDNMSHEDFVNNLNIKVVSNLLTENKGLAFSRCADLLSKTNQFNTASKHLNISEFSSFIEKNTVVYFSVSDKLQDYGIVGVVLLESSTNTIVQYVMSCRVLGMDVEYKVLDQLFDILKTNNLKAILNKTDKNKACHDLFLKNDFTCLDGVWVKEMK